MRAVFFLAALCCSLIAYPQTTRVDKIRKLEPQVTDFFRRAQYVKSLELADSILKLAPANMVYLIFCYETSLVELRDTVRAVNYLKKIVITHPFEPDYLDQYGWVMLKGKDLAAAVEFTGRAFRLEQESLAVLINHAHALHAKGETARALEIYQRAAEITFSPGQYARNQGQDFMLLDPLYPGFSRLGVEQGNEFGRLLQAYELPNSIALVIDSLERYNAAEGQLVTYWQRALDAEQGMNPLRRKNISRYHSALGDYYDHQGNGEAAKMHYHAALEHQLASQNEPGVARSYQRLGALYRKNGHVDSAEYFYRMACRTYQKIPGPVDLARTYMQLAELHLDQGRQQAAWLLARDSVVPSFERYNAHDDLVPAYEFLAEQYARKGVRDSQRIYLEKAIEVVGLNSLPPSLLENVHKKLESLSRAKDHPRLPQEATHHYNMASNLISIPSGKERYNNKGQEGWVQMMRVASSVLLAL